MRGHIMRNKIRYLDKSESELCDGYVVGTESEKVWKCEVEMHRRTSEEAWEKGTRRGSERRVQEEAEVDRRSIGEMR